MYNIRTNKGVLKAVVDRELFSRLIAESEGHFEIKKLEKGDISVFVFDDDYVYGNHQTKSFIWKNDYLEIK